MHIMLWIYNSGSIGLPTFAQDLQLDLDLRYTIVASSKSSSQTTCRFDCWKKNENLCLIKIWRFISVIFDLRTPTYSWGRVMMCKESFQLEIIQKLEITKKAPARPLAFLWNSGRETLVFDFFFILPYFRRNIGKFEVLLEVFWFFMKSHMW